MSSVGGAVNAVPPHARAVLKVRVHPEQGSIEAQEAVMEHLCEVQFAVPAPTTDAST